MNGAAWDPTVTERELREMVRGVGLVGELELSPTSRTYLIARESMQRLIGRGYSSDAITRLYPATTVVYLVGNGVYRYNRGAFWSQLDVEGIDPEEMGAGFLKALECLGLETFRHVKPEGPYKAVTPILLHGGIPRYCARDVLKLLVAEMRQGNVEAVEMISRWVQSPSRMIAVDRPVRRFLTHGGEQAVDLVERLIEMVIEVSEGREPDPDELGLPAYLVEEFLDLPELERHPGHRATDLPTPVVVFNYTSCGGPELVLPAVPQSRGVVGWAVVTDRPQDRPQRYPALSTRKTVVPLPEAARWEVHLLCADGPLRSTTFRGVSGTRVLFFDPANQQLLRTQDRLAVDTVVALAPRGFAFRNGGRDGEPVAHIEDLPPLDGAWRWFEAHHLDLRGVTTLWLGDPTPSTELPAAEATVRVTGPSQRPSLKGTPCPGIAGTDGRMVFGVPPVLEVPGGPRLGWKHWRLRARVNGAPISVSLDELPAKGQDVDLAAILPTGSIATVDFNVVGPLGSDLRNVRFLLVPGIDFPQPPGVLRPDEATELNIFASPHVQLGGKRQSTAVVPLAAGEDSAQLRASDGEHEVELVLTVPRLAWSLHRGRTQAGQLGSCVVVMTSDEILADDRLLVRTGSRGTRLRLELVSGPDRLQETPWIETDDTDGRGSFALAPFLDTIRNADRPRVQFQIRLGEHSIIVADVVTTYIATITRAEGLVDPNDGLAVLDLAFEENRWCKNREVRMWSIDRPWEQSRRVPVPDDTSGSDGVLLDVRASPGRYMVEIGLADDWSTPPRPRRGAPHVAEVTLGDEADLRSYLRSRRDSTPLAKLEYGLAAPADVVSFDEAEAGQVAPQALQALAALLDDLGHRALDDPRFSVIAGVLHHPEALIRGIRAVVDADLLEPADVKRTLILLLPDLLDQHWDFDDVTAIRLHRLDPLLAALLDPARVDDDEGRQARWTEYLGWHPDGRHPDGRHAYPFKGGPVDATWLQLSPDRLQEIELLLDLTKDQPLADGGFIIGMFEWLKEEHGERKARTASWIDRFKGLNDRRLRQLSEQHKLFLEALKPKGLDPPTLARFPFDLLAAAMQLVSIPSSRAKATEALLQAIEISPALVERNLIVAIVLHRG